jgi:phytol kinase
MTMLLSRLPEWAGVLGVAVFLLGTLGLTYAAKRWCALSPELSRKVMHLALGASALAFPWLFHSSWPPIAIAVMTIGVLALLRSDVLGTDASTVVHGVVRRSEGDLYFPLAAAVAFILARGDTLVYSIPLLTLTLADTVAAVVGRRFGHTRFPTLDPRARKSAEGSLAFLVVAFLATYASLSVFASVAPIKVLLIAAVFGIHVTLIEAASWRGLDNLFVPVIGLMLLHRLLSMDARSLTTLLIVTIALLMLVLSVWPSTLSRPQRTAASARTRRFV